MGSGSRRGQLAQCMTASLVSAAVSGRGIRIEPRAQVSGKFSDAPGDLLDARIADGAVAGSAR